MQLTVPDLTGPNMRNMVTRDQLKASETLLEAVR